MAGRFCGTDLIRIACVVSCFGIEEGYSLIGEPLQHLCHLFVMCAYLRHSLGG